MVTGKSMRSCTGGNKLLIHIKLKHRLLLKKIIIFTSYKDGPLLMNIVGLPYHKGDPFSHVGQLTCVLPGHDMQPQPLKPFWKVLIKYGKRVQ